MNVQKPPPNDPALKDLLQTDASLPDSHFAGNKTFVIGAIFFAALFFAAEIYILLRYVYDAKEVAENIEISAQKNLTIPATKPAQPTPTPVDETIGWKTYFNERFGFQIKYPPTLQLKEEIDSVLIYSDFVITVKTLKPETKKVPAFNLTIKRQAGALEEMARGHPEGTFRFGQNTFEMFFDGAEGTGLSSYYLKGKDNMWFVFSLYSAIDDDVDYKDKMNPDFWDANKRRQTQHQILSTFRFL